MNLKFLAYNLTIEQSNTLVVVHQSIEEFQVFFLKYLYAFYITPSLYSEVYVRIIGRHCPKIFSVSAIPPIPRNVALWPQIPLTQHFLRYLTSDILSFSVGGSCVTETSLF
jgi:hypothetical protein